MTGHQRKSELYYAGNLEAARVIAADPNRYPGAMQEWAARIEAAGADPQLRSEALAAVHQVATMHADLLQLALKDLSARRHSTMISEARPLWAISREAR